jgi:hypothetical protein
VDSANDFLTAAVSTVSDGGIVLAHLFSLHANSDWIAFMKAAGIIPVKVQRAAHNAFQGLAR